MVDSNSAGSKILRLFPEETTSFRKNCLAVQPPSFFPQTVTGVLTGGHPRAQPCFQHEDAFFLHLFLSFQHFFLLQFIIFYYYLSRDRIHETLTPGRVTRAQSSAHPQDFCNMPILTETSHSPPKCRIVRQRGPGPRSPPTSYATTPGPGLASLPNSVVSRKLATGCPYALLVTIPKHQLVFGPLDLFVPCCRPTRSQEHHPSPPSEHLCRADSTWFFLPSCGPSPTAAQAETACRTASHLGHLGTKHLAAQVSDHNLGLSYQWH